MKNFKTFFSSMLIGFLCFLLPNDANAVAFKCKNDSEYKVRLRAYDRGNWRSWVEFNPGGWGDFAKSVTRSTHTIEIEIMTESGWRHLYQGNHGSKAYTRIVQIIEVNEQPQLVWWDERFGGCRDAPPHPVHGGNSCLDKSGEFSWNNIVNINPSSLIKYSAKSLYKKSYNAARKGYKLFKG